MDTTTQFLTTFVTSVSTSGLLIWLGKNWIGERIKGSIKHEYEAKLEALKAQLELERDKKIEQLKDELGEKSAERNARRDYEYAAKLKLYGEYEPLLFQLIEQAEHAYYRIRSLARATREGKLTVGGDGWLDHPGYYLRSTAYKLLAPIALFKIIQRHLTFVDLSVDTGIAANYGLAKILYLTFTCDFELARMHPKLDYEPIDIPNGKEVKKPQRFWRQGIPLGHLDNVLDDCLLNNEQSPRLRNFGDFERTVEQLKADDKEHAIGFVDYILHNFHPATRPVLWRVLIAQAHILRLLMERVCSQSASPRTDLLNNLALPGGERAELRWADDQQQAQDEAFSAAEAFVKKYIEEFKMA